MRNKNNQNGKSYQNNNRKGPRNKDTQSRIEDKLEKFKAKTNDVTWYTKFDALAKSSANIVYGTPMGDVLQFNDQLALSALSGIMKIDLLPAIGISKDATSPVNTMSRLVYSFIRHANSGSRNYEAADYMTYCLALGSAYAFYASLCRVYGIIRTYSVMNKYVAKSMVEALGFDYDAIVKDLANFRYYINYFAARINTFAVPKEMSYYDRMAYLPYHIFKDNDGDKCSFYLFDFAKLFYWDGTQEGGSALLPIDWGITENKTLQDVQSVGDTIINALLSNEDIGIMSGDTLKAYGSAGVRTINAIDESFACLPHYDHNMIWQIHNARIADISNVITQDRVTQKDGYLVFNPVITGFTGPQLGGQDLLMDSDLETPDYKFNLENSRLHVRYKTGMTGFDSCGTELPIRAKIYYFNKDVGDEEMLLSSLTPGDFTLSESSSILGGELLGLLQTTTFKLHPIWYVQTEFEGQKINLTPFGDFNNYAQVSALAIAQMHNTALLSLFAVPHAAAAAK